MENDRQCCSSGVPSFADCIGDCIYAKPIMKAHKKWHYIISARVRAAIVAHSLRKPQPRAQLSLEKLLGYRFSKLIAHIEGKFRAGMTWENISEWNIDHIVPRYKFPVDSLKHPNVKRCWKLSNLQLLWVQENVHKNIQSWCVL